MTECFNKLEIVITKFMQLLNGSYWFMNPIKPILLTAPLNFLHEALNCNFCQFATTSTRRNFPSDMRFVVVFRHPDLNLQLFVHVLYTHLTSVNRCFPDCLQGYQTQLSRHQNRDVPSDYTRSSSCDSSGQGRWHTPSFAGFWLCESFDWNRVRKFARKQRGVRHFLVVCGKTLEKTAWLERVPLLLPRKTNAAATHLNAIPFFKTCQNIRNDENQDMIEFVLRLCKWNNPLPGCEIAE